MPYTHELVDDEHLFEVDESKYAPPTKRRKIIGYTFLVLAVSFVVMGYISAGIRWANDESPSPTNTNQKH